jgi:hypothetical protein
MQHNRQAELIYFDAKPFYLVIMVIVVIIWYSTRVNTSYVMVAFFCRFRIPSAVHTALSKQPPPTDLQSTQEVLSISITYA